MSEETTPFITPESINRVLITSDLAQLSEEEKTAYYRKLCETIGLNELTLPFSYIAIDGKLQLYANKDFFAQVRQLMHLSVTITDRRMLDDVAVVTARAVQKDCRIEESVAAVTLGAMTGTRKANAIMACETKAKRRAIIGLMGLGMLCEMEVEEIHGAIKPAQEEPPAKPAPDEVLAPISAQNWRCLICHVGTPKGKIYGKTMHGLIGEIAPEREEMLKHFETVVVPKLDATDFHDSRLIEAVEFARTKFNADKSGEAVKNGAPANE